MTNPGQVIPAAYHQNIKKVIFNQPSIDSFNDEYVSPRTFFLKPQSASSMSLNSSTYVKATNFTSKLQNSNHTKEYASQNPYNMAASYRLKINFEKMKSKIHIGTSILLNKYTSESLGKSPTNIHIHVNKRETKKANKENKPPFKNTINSNKSINSSNIESFNSSLTKKNLINNSRILSSNSYFQNSSTSNPSNPVLILNDQSVGKFSTENQIGNLSLELINLEKKLIMIQSQSAPIRKRNYNLNENFTSSHILETTNSTKTKPTSSRLNYANQLKSSSFNNAINANIDDDLKHENREAETNKLNSSDLTTGEDTIEKLNNKALMKSKTTPLTKFRRVVQCVILLQEAINSFKTKLNENSSLYLKQDEKKKINFIDLDGIVFDVNNFKRVKEIGLSDDAKRILRMPFEKRTDDQIKIALSSIIDSVPDFEDYPIQMQKSILKVSLLQEFQAGRVIIRQNHKADNFYLIVSGITSISVFGRNPLNDEPQNRVVAYLSKGKSFGELAIMHGATRNATVTCHTDVSVLCIGRDDFVDIFMRQEQGKDPGHISFLKEINLLNSFPVDLLPHHDTKVCLLTYFRRGVIICKENNANDWIYFVKQGSCRIIKDIKIVKKNISVLNKPLEIPQKYLEFYSKNQRYTISLNKEIDLKNRLKENYDQIIDKKEYRSKNSDSEKSIYIEIKKLLPKESFGLVEILFPNETTKVSLVSDGAECIMINKKFFIEHLTEEIRKQLKIKIHPYPCEFELQKKYQINTNWQTFKKDTINKYYKRPLKNIKN